MLAKVLRSRLAYAYGKTVDNRVNWSENFDRKCHIPAISSSPVWSLYNCKRVVKTSKYGFTEGPACIETTCPCSVPATGAKIFINKTSGKYWNPVPGPDLLIPGFYLTGSFICAKCHYTGKFSAIEDFFPEPKAKDQQIAIAQKREKFQTRKAVQRLDLPSVWPVKDVPDQELNELLNNFSLVIFSDHF